MISTASVINVVAATFAVYFLSALTGGGVTAVSLFRDGYGLLPSDKTPALTDTTTLEALKLHMGVSFGIMLGLLAVEGVALIVAALLVGVVGIPLVSVTLPIFFLIPLIRFAFWLFARAFGYRVLPMDVPPIVTGRLLGYYVVASTVFHAAAFFVLVV